MDGNVCAHAYQFGHVHKAVFKNGFGDHAGPFGNRQHGHGLRLQIGRETGIGLGHDINAAQGIVDAFDGDGLLVFVDDQVNL